MPISLTSQISVGNIISAGTILVLVSVQWGFNDSRMAHAEDRLNRVEQEYKGLDATVRDMDRKLTIIDVKQQQQIDQQKDIKKLLDQVIEQLKSQPVK